MLFRVHNGNLVVESKDGDRGQDDYIYHKLTVPTDVDFKTIQTKVVGDKLIVSADKIHHSPPPRNVASPASSTSSYTRFMVKLLTFKI